MLDVVCGSMASQMTLGISQSLRAIGPPSSFIIVFVNWSFARARAHNMLSCYTFITQPFIFVSRAPCSIDIALRDDNFDVV